MTIPSQVHHNGENPFKCIRLKKTQVVSWGRCHNLKKILKEIKRNVTLLWTSDPYGKYKNRVTDFITVYPLRFYRLFLLLLTNERSFQLLVILEYYYKRYRRCKNAKLKQKKIKAFSLQDFLYLHLIQGSGGGGCI